MAWHDRRTEDLEGGGHKKVDDPNDPDPHYDQRFRPKGAFFLELYNPWVTTGPSQRFPQAARRTLFGLRRR